jgi:hypothetical protein
MISSFVQSCVHFEKCSKHEGKYRTKNLERFERFKDLCPEETWPLLKGSSLNFQKSFNKYHLILEPRLWKVGLSLAFSL